MPLLSIEITDLFILYSTNWLLELEASLKLTVTRKFISVRWQTFCRHWNSFKDRGILTYNKRNERGEEEEEEEEWGEKNEIKNG